MAPRVIVVGGGLSGLSAAHTIYLAGGNVVVLDKASFLWWKTQQVLTYKSAAAVEWLQECIRVRFNPRITARGHSHPRTHRGHDAKFPGMAITYALMQRLEELAEAEPERVRIIKKARVTGLIKERK
ncbi:hypothetical protein DID88_008920 [Monilinia fructigena]|uniref:FAD-dependent oxidoreductase 2 FAD-binding domain-containing protein n=1 Tax=Monilinia fructigena TaxID=38457 RepID=A0A395J7H3_9HELO|nr:hypothetical protein DID88_008920 [Monilinia fructigena]